MGIRKLLLLGLCILLIGSASAISLQELLSGYDFNYISTVSVNDIVHYGLDTGGDSKYEILAINISLTNSDNYRIVADLINNGVKASKEINITGNKVTLQFDATNLIDDRYNLSVKIYNTKLLYRNLNNYSFTINRSNYMDNNINIEIINDYGLNTDIDPEYETLIIQANITATANAYDIEAVIDGIEFKINKVLPSVFNLEFPAKEIYEKQIDKQLFLDKIKINNAYYNVNYTTANYSYKSFDPENYVKNYYEDFNGNLELTFEIKVNQTGTHTLKYGLSNLYGNKIIDYSQDHGLNVGLNNITTIIDGKTIYNSKINGPYIISYLEIADFTTYNPYQTFAYSYKNFTEVKMPDLKIINLTIINEPYTDAGTVNITIINLGDTQAFSVDVILFDDDKILKEKTIDIIDNEAQILFKRLNISNRIWKAYVDFYDNIEEKNESNNNWPRNESTPIMVIDNPPTVIIHSPLAGTYQNQTLLLFNGTATDDEDGELLCFWYSDIDGYLGNGTFTYSNLSISNHTITLNTKDSQNQETNTSINITIIPILFVNNPPSAHITIPFTGQSFAEGSAIWFVGRANDTEDGDLTDNNLRWYSDIDGNFHNTSSYSYKNLSVGYHKITLSAIDSNGLTDNASIFINITQIIIDETPNATIISPIAGNYLSNESLMFNGFGIDKEDGNLTGNSLVWTSNLNGNIGNGSFFIKQLNSGLHIITLTITDSALNQDQDSAIINISEVIIDNPPTAFIYAPIDGGSYMNGTNILFNGSGIDGEDGNLVGKWYSDIDGNFMNGTEFNYILSYGYHKITIVVEDSKGQKNNATIYINITPTIIINNPPVAYNITSSTNVYTDTNIYVNYDYDDLDGDFDNSNYTLYINNNNIHTKSALRNLNIYEELTKTNYFASSTFSPDYEPWKTGDRIVNNMWLSANVLNVEDCWVTIDLGIKRRINEINVWYMQDIGSYNVSYQYSNDNNTWYNIIENLDTTKYNHTGFPHVYNTGNLKTRYIKILANKGSGYISNLFGISEIIINGASISINNSLFSKNDNIIVQINPYDNKEYGNSINTSPIIIKNSMPMLFQENYTGWEDTILSVTLNGIDKDNDTLIYEIMGSGPGISCVVTENLTVTPLANWNGVSYCDIRTYDGENYSTITRYDITINPVNDEPQMTLIPVQNIDMNSGLHSIILDATDIDSSNLTFSVVFENISEVDCNIIGNNLTFSPFVGFTGTGSCIVKVDDGLLDDQELVTINVNTLPDLVVTQFYMTTQNPLVGEPIFFRFTIKNIGSVAASNIVWYLDSNSMMDRNNTQPYNLGPNEEMPSYMWVQYNSSGTYSPTLIADHLNTITEVNESNNEMQINIII